MNNRDTELRTITRNIEKEIKYFPSSCVLVFSWLLRAVTQKDHDQMLLLVKLFIQCVSFVKSHEIKCRTEQHITSKSWD